jgi:hypothetical protein
MQESDEPAYELIRPEDFLARDRTPWDARRMGVDRWTGDDGALILLAASLDPTKTSHKVVAWIMLIAITMPVVATLWYEFL